MWTLVLYYISYYCSICHKYNVDFANVYPICFEHIECCCLYNVVWAVIPVIDDL